MFVRVEAENNQYVYLNLRHVVVAEVYRNDTVILYALPKAGGEGVRRFFMDDNGVECRKAHKRAVIAELEKDSRFVVEHYPKNEQRMFVNVEKIVSFEYRTSTTLDKCAFVVLWNDGTESRISNINLGSSFDGMILKEQPEAAPDAVR